MKNIWVGDLICLRALEEHDKEEYFSYPAGSLSQKLYDELCFPSNAVSIGKKFNELMKNDGENFCFLIQNKNDDIVGHILTYDCNKRNGTFKFGIEIKQEFWRNGYGSQSIKLLLNYYFNYLRYNKVVSMVYQFNGPSLTMHQKLGFIKEGQLRQMIYSDGKYYDLLYYGMTMDEFNKLYSEEFKIISQA